MSAFEVTITPTRLRNVKRQEVCSPTVVCMAPFSSKSIVEFQDVPLGKTAKRILRIMNPTDEDIELNVTKTVPLEYNLSIEWSTKLLPAMSEIQMELIWMPRMDCASKEKMQITDNRNFRKDVEILFKSKCNQVKTTRKFPTLSSSSTKSSSSASSSTYVKTLRLKSPKNNMKPVKRTTNPHNGNSTSSSHMHAQSKQKNCQQKQTLRRSLPPPAVAVAAAVATSNDKNGKTCLQLQRQPLTTSNALLSFNSTATLRNLNISPIISGGAGGGGGSEHQHDNENLLKENISPLATNNMLDLIDNLNFTPATVTVSKSQTRQTFNNLTFLPTPVNHGANTYIAVVNESSGTTPSTTRQLKPRKLTIKELEGTSSNSNNTNQIQANQHPEIQINFAEVTNQTPVITNKTFDVNATEVLNFTQELLNVSPLNGGGGGAAPIGIVMNQTTTIQCTPLGRTLTMIKEEDDHLTLPTTTKTSLSPASIENLKRDIKLIATPLRKYSESMQDLSLKSPQNKLAIQGSMPNLNEMESIRHFEQNRYLHQSSSQQSLNDKNHNNLKKRMSTVHEQNSPGDISAIVLTNDMINQRQTMLSTSHAELNFNQQEITAQSSRFNLNEVGLSKHKQNNSPSNNLKQQKQATNNSKHAMYTTKGFKANSSQRSSPKEPPPPRITQSIGQKRLLRDLSFSDTQSTDSLASTDSQKQQKSSYKVPLAISPPKRQRIESNNSNSSFLKPTPVSGTGKDWSRVQPKKVPRLSKTLSFTKRPITPRKSSSSNQTEARIQLYDPDTFLQTCINPDPFAATTTCDPFLASTMYLDQQAVERHQIDFRKWLNALVTIPAELDADTNIKIDVGRLFQEVRNKDLTLAPTKEQQSMSYLNNFRLDSLRRAAVELFLSEEIRTPCSKVAVYVTKQVIGIRHDRNLHLDVVMQRNILELLLYFNPLWLRLGLEVVFGEKIHLQSNRDVVGLSAFILNRLFRDKFLEQKYSKAYTLSDEYAEYIKKFTLQKMLFLLLFLDKAKTKRIIKHNPCLFIKKSPYKETKEVLLKLSSELLAKIGDITRELKRFGYVLQHKQSYLDEFDYAFNNLAIDLRDGVRLTRVIEIILLRDDLTQQLRVPAISRLQRIFNVNLGLRALSDADFQLCGDISAADIVDGHREKTLSVLWQIIYKFRSPRFHAAARTIQMWWRNNWLRITIRRRIEQKAQQRRELAATKIQACYRGFIARRYVQIYKAERVKAAIVLQKYTRRFLVQHRIVIANNAALVIQRSYRARFHMLEERAVYQRKRKAIILIQRKWRATLLARRTKVQFITLQYYTILTQQRFRANKKMQLERSQYLRLRAAVVNVQQRYRAKRAMIKARQEFQHQMKSVIVLQRRFRAYKAMRFQRAKYQGTRNATICLQQHIRAYLLMKQISADFQNLKSAATFVQRTWRTKLQMRQERFDYQRLRAATIAVQRRYRGKLEMRKQMMEYQEKLGILIAMQRRFKAKLLAREVRKEYYEKRVIIIQIQRRFRANQAMRTARQLYSKQRTNCITIQRYFRSYVLTKSTQLKFKEKRSAAIRIQNWYRATLQMQVQREKYQQLRLKTLIIQRKWRATLLAREQRNKYQQTLAKIVCIQRRLRATLKMREVRLAYQAKKRAAIVLQQRYRARLEMLKIRSQYQLIVALTICLQRKFRARQAMRQQRAKYLLLRRTTIHLQQKQRGKLLTEQARAAFLNLRQSVPAFQARVRGFQARARFQALLTPEMLEFIRQKRAARIIQRYYRGYRVRKRFQNACLKLIRRNLIESKAKAHVTNSLRFKLQEAVQVLRGRYSISEILSVLQRLERLSRIVPHLLMPQSEFISTFCYGIMAQAIRSEIDKQMIELCSRIILNLARYDSINANTFQENGLVTIAQMLLRWCDKDCEIFNTLCTLVWLFAHCKEKRSKIRTFMITSEAIYMLRETKKLVARKEKMKSNDRRQIVSKERQTFSIRALPSLEPDYGYIQQKPYTFISSVYAFDSLLCILDVNV